ncbi:AAA family ATPase [Shewanella sp. 10N.7]|uniref:AAA family ATPase n=1 Tax=Shewanella sp. 10N.7 TaxID=2885093 RepID=UPI001E34F776|nr:AAA family ATPase [Shewanella sp. 10N.7]MCC4832821.1 AAA family ATPase [Shewanella sp. 10N.7]
MSHQSININQRYKSSTRIDGSHIDYKGFIDDFILHGTAVNVLDTLSRDFDGSEQRAYTLTGPYGSGKSTIALYLSSLLSQDAKVRKLATAKLKNANGLLDSFTSRFKVSKGWKVVKHVCGLESPANAILASLYKALEINFTTEEVAQLNDEQCLSKIKETLAIKQNFDGVLFLLDEMGKALDFQSRANKDLHLFQSLADIAQQSSTPVLLIGFLHQSFTDYAKNKDAKAQNEWAKVQGRYRDLSFNPSIDESLVLVGDSLTKEETLSLKLIDTHANVVQQVANSFEKQERNVSALMKTLPLDPLVSLLLGPISRRRFSQNERSLFGFLASHEKLGFREFLTENYHTKDNDLQLYKPEKLWDYLHHTLHHLIITSSDSKAWLEGCDAIYRASQKGSALHISITKVIALLTIFGFHHHLHARKDFLIQYFKARGELELNIIDALEELERWTVIIYRQKHDALFVFQGSDIDIHNLVLEKIESVSEGVDWTKVCDSSQNILATAHYHKSGTMRWANTKLINKVDSELISSLQDIPLSGTSYLTFLLPANPLVEKELQRYESELDYAVIGSNTSLNSLKNSAIEFIALKQIENEEEKINHDQIAKNELANRMKHAAQSIEMELSAAFSKATWLYKGEHFSKLPLSAISSRVADNIFHAAPEVINELINRSKPSGSANSAIRKLMNAMLTSGDIEDLGFDNDSFPPEKGIYLSCLKNKGWHTKTGEGFVFPNEWDKSSSNFDSKMHGLWLDGFEFIKSSNEMVTLDQLYRRWMMPPFGLTTGLCRIYGLALLKSLEGKVAYYDLDSTKQFIFIPELDEELVTKIYKHPKEAGVRYFEISEIQTHLLDTLAKATIGSRKEDDTVLEIAKHIVKIVHTLPAWVKKTSGESFSSNKSSNGLTREARAFRNKVIAANDPYKLILEDLPEVFDLDKSDKNLDEKLGQRLKTAIQDLSAQHDMLLSGFKQIVTTNLSAEFNDDLKKRCKLIVDTAQRPNVKELASRIIKFIDGKSTFELVVNLATGVPERNWTDKHLRNGLDELQNLCIQFRRIESFGNIQKKGSSKPLAFITSDSSGNYKEFGGFIKHDLENDSEVKKAINSVSASISNIPKEKQLAALTELLSSLMEPSEQEKAND